MQQLELIAGLEGCCAWQEMHVWKEFALEEERFSKGACMIWEDVQV